MTNYKKFNNSPDKIRILITPLDWGLGHATRCIPIIKELIYQGCEVIIAASKAGYFLLKKEFPDIVILRIKSNKITYSKKKFWLPFKVFLQLLKIFFSTFQDQKWLNRIIKTHNINIVISDNRFGMNNKKIPSVFITHQLFIKTGSIFSERIAQKINYHFIKKYKYCWVPDFKVNDLAGVLSHPGNIPSNVRYIGAISRFETLPGITKKYDVLILISGPEPQRTIFEKMILPQLSNSKKNVLIVRGLPASDEEMETGSVKMVNHLSGLELNLAIQQSEILIARSGYTTIMDLVKLGKKAILVPTPGQTEQEYLAKYMMEKKYFYAADQENFVLDSVLIAASSFGFIAEELPMNAYKKVIQEFVLLLKSGNF